MQGAHDWAENLDKAFDGHGYYKSYADPQIPSRVINDEFTLTSTWTDDILGASSTIEGEQMAKDQLAKTYEIKDMGETTLILGMHIKRNDNGDVTLLQESYGHHLLERFNMSHCTPVSTPLPPGTSLSVEDCPTTPQEVDEMKSVPYREALGSLMWLQVATHPDLSYTVNILSRFAHNPGRTHWNAMKHTLAYVKSTLNYGITYKGGEPLNPVGYVDSDYAGCKGTRCSTEGNIFVVVGGPVSWQSKRQEIVALSTVKSEYMAFTRATSQVLWIIKFFAEIGLPIPTPITIYADNNGFISNSTTNKHHCHTKHIDIKFHFVNEHTKKREVIFNYIPSANNIADLFTKPLPWDTVRRLAATLDLIL